MNVRRCVYCDQEFDIADKPSGWMANHTRWCLQNPKRKEYIDKLKSTNIDLMNEAKKISGKTNRYSKAKIEGYEPAKYDSPLKGKPGRKHTEATKNKLSEIARNSPHRRLKKNVIKYTHINGDVITLDSNWEFELAKRLDILNIEWVRPDPLIWKDKDGLNHHYFPDFYLPEYNIYLDPKNPYAIKIQKEKLDILMNMYDNIHILHSIEECKNYVPVT